MQVNIPMMEKPSAPDMSPYDADEEAGNHANMIRYKSRLSVVLGGVHISLAIFSLIYNVVCFLMWRNFFSAYWPGAWAGAVFFFTGFMGIVAARKKTKCFVYSFLAANIFTILVAVGAFFLTMFGIWFDSSYDGLVWAPTAPSYVFIAVLACEILTAGVASLLCCVSKNNPCYRCS